MPAAELRHLRSFVAVAEELHFGRAAARLGLAQPAVSRHVRALEEQLDAPLLVRSARETRLTDAGRAALPHARAAVEAADRVASAARAAAAGGGTGQVLVGFVATTVGVHLPRLLRAMADRHPDIAIVPSQLRSANVLPALRRGTVDAVIARHQPKDAAIHAVLLEREPIVLAAPDDHPLAQRADLVTADLAGTEYIALDPAILRGHADIDLADLKARGIEPARVVRAPSLRAALGLVQTGAGVYRLPAVNAPPLPGLVYVPVTDSEVMVTLFRRREPPSPALAAFEAVALDLAAAAAD